jgi:formyltetrahydrofolate deformylase
LTGPAPEATIIRLVAACRDRPGIVAAVSQFLFRSGANILHSDQHTTDPTGGMFFLRMEFHYPLPNASLDELKAEFDASVGSPLGMQWRMWDTAERKRIAVMASRADHCVLDLLWRWRRGELEGEIVMVISNHENLRQDVDAFGVPFHHTEVSNVLKPRAEAEQLELLRDSVDVVVLARYMQILSKDFLDRVGVPIINIHHSFLPAFAGAEPHARARDRGVKLIGATAHYVTEELDAGPIIEQDVIRVSHRFDAAAMSRVGSDIERIVLARAVQWHLEDRVLLDGNTTVVF